MSHLGNAEQINFIDPALGLVPSVCAYMTAIPSERYRHASFVGQTLHSGKNPMRFYGEIPIRRLYPMPIRAGVDVVRQALAICVAANMFDQRIGVDKIEVLIRH